MGNLKIKSRAAIDIAVRVFVDKVEKDRGYKLINKNITYNEFLKNRMLIVHSIREGIPYHFFDLIKERTPFNEEDWATFLGISAKSLQRNKAKENFVFKALQSEKIFELAEVTSLGKEVFDTDEQFYSWLKTPSFALGNLKPIELLKDSYGKEMVVNELNKIDQGIFV
ncbi:putative toxin-antitoxin system antitoxin component (TIGR02293 family) [Flavobacterium sp. CG_23.5]|uniref:type II RES/Xre toxin-antitoxin system antitoxin n=1 Tax=Flavobacterium sp. CG_23.5 TaxID=2760708 RepID=UPI001AE30527|nr:antitoxin Xre/MbcA/ParS toxin-binding domain-containing protein [Flavobacterium sp. CG_23.5]MBP2283196.1 putative toxin-antitoxin system antitoxin component (TIGR02293 family) [Flavobacterium sp. CG_23.5]